MSADAARAAEALDRRYLLDYPADAATWLESRPPDEAAGVLLSHPVEVLVPVWIRLMPQTSVQLYQALPAEWASELLAELPPSDAVRLLSQLEVSEREAAMTRLDAAVARELGQLMTFPADSAGHLMETRVVALHGTVTGGEALAVLRRQRGRVVRNVYVVDDNGRLAARVALEALALADPGEPLQALAQPVAVTVTAVAPGAEITELLEQHALLDLPVVDLDGVLLGVISPAGLVQAVQEEASADLQTMVGASREERALSRPLFAVRKRMPWLQINLLTAFAAAAVVGLFEATIARFTALAVLLPVVAGQSGNAGAQALAVTMRGLALREITVRHWLRVMFKEVRVGLFNGLAVAITCGLGVYVWSGSVGLVLVIALSMVLAMVAAGFAGALVPIVLTRLGQDPAQSSSIILTTVTDIAGFFAFLGIATLLAGLL